MISVNYHHGQRSNSEVVTDDTIRFYLQKIGEFPLLARKEELDLAERIESSRRRFRREVLSGDLAVRSLVGLLQQTQAGGFRLDRVVQLPSDDPTRRGQIQQMLACHLRTLSGFVEQNAADFALVRDRRQSLAVRRQAWHRLSRRRHKAARLLEEFDLRYNCFEQLYHRWLESWREWKAAVQVPDESGPRSTRRNVNPDELLATWQHTVRSFRRQVNRIQRAHHIYQRAKQRMAEANLRLVV